MQDVVAEYPDEIIDFQFYNNGQIPEDMEYEKGVYCLWQGRFFIHTRATLPLKDIERGVGFGLWVELTPEDFERYADALEDDKKYEAFTTKGILANEWPGFEGIIGSEVTVKTVNLNEKVYITEVLVDETNDPLFSTAVSASSENAEIKAQVTNLVHAYIENQEEV